MESDRKFRARLLRRRVAALLDYWDRNPEAAASDRRELAEAEERARSKRVGIGARKRFAILKRDGFRCRYCGATAEEAKLHVDHAQPVSKGGTNARRNLVTACARCNLGKSDSVLE